MTELIQPSGLQVEITPVDYDYASAESRAQFTGQVEQYLSSTKEQL